MTPATEEMLLSDLADLGDVPLNATPAIDAGQYARLMRQIGVTEGEAGTPVSAFNSSI